MFRKFQYFPALIFSLLAIGCGPLDRGPDEAILKAGKQVYQDQCAACHKAAGSGAPLLSSLQMMNGDAIESALLTGKMAQQGSLLSDEERTSLIAWLTKDQADMGEWEEKLACEAPAAPSPGDTKYITSWGFDDQNHRVLQDSVITAQNVGALREVWTLAFPGASTMRSQPVIIGDTLYLAVYDTQKVYAFDQQTGCLRWTHEAGDNPRTALSAARYKDRLTLLFGDTAGLVTMIYADTGELVWRKPLGISEKTTFTGPITVRNDKFYLVHSSTETLASVEEDYECCTLSGAVSAHKLSDGSKIWAHRTLSEAKRRKKSSAGTQLWGPAGASAWAAPVIDDERGLIYFGTGPISAPPDEGTGDAIIAVDLKSGKRRWTFQATKDDFWNGACRAPHPDGQHPNCPGTDGVDFDFGAGIMRVTTPNGRDLIIAGQKSGVVHALDPDNGSVVWQSTIGSGGLLGGIHWGMAYKDGALYVPVNDPDFTKHPGLSDAYKAKLGNYVPKSGLYRLNVENGEVEWSWQPEPGCKASFAVKEAWPDCPPQFGLSSAILLTNELVISGGMDGKWRAFEAATGKLIAEYDTYREYRETLNGISGHGGSIDNATLAIADDMVFVQSGYSYFGGTPGNMLIAYKLNGE